MSFLLVTSSSFPATFPFPALMMITISIIVNAHQCHRAGLAIVGLVTGNVLWAGQIASEGCFFRRALNTLG